MLKSPKNLGVIHFIGIGGIGMSGIAEILFQSGYSVQAVSYTHLTLPTTPYV